MSNTVEQSDAAIRKTFYSMEKGVDYVLDDFWFAEMNGVREEYGYSSIKNKNDYILTRKGEKLFYNGRQVFDFNNKTNLALAFALTLALDDTFAFTFALQYNGIEKLNNSPVIAEHPIVSCFPC